MDKSSNTRTTGFYWVKYQGEWEIASWGSCHRYDHWSLIGTGAELRDKDFEEIDKKRLTYD